MAAHPDVDRSLSFIRASAGRIAAELAGLPPEAWDRTSSCPPWLIRQLLAHVIISGEQFCGSVERGLAGLTEPAAPEGDRERRIREVGAAPPEELLARLGRETELEAALYERLSAADLEAICYHRRGNRPARWYIQHRLAEVAFHLWDLRRSLDRPARLDPEVAAFLLPMLLESNLPRIYPNGPRGDGRFRLVAEDLPGGAWLLAASPERLDVRRDGGPADVTIAAPATVLALLVYGRADLAEEERAGRAKVEGDRALAARFNTIFRGP